MAATFERPSVTEELARAMIDEAERKAAEMGHPFVLIVFGGGYPIKIGDTVVGGIGVSGGHYSQDMEVAQAGLTAVPAS